MMLLAGLTYLVWRRTPHHPWLLPLVTGAFVGGCVFLWIYLNAYREHHEFPLEVITSKLKPFRGDLRGYDSLGSFAVVLLLGVVGWIPRAG